MRVKKIWLRVLGILVLLFLLYEFVPLTDRVIIGRRQASQTQPFTQYAREAELRVLIIGDSSAVGTGADKPADSIAGRLAQDYPSASIANLAENGAVTEEVLAQLESIGGFYDLLIINTGANDILRFTSLEKFEQELSLLLQKAKSRAKVVVLFTTGDASTSPLLPNTLARVYGNWSVDYRNIALKLARENGVVYVDIIGHERAAGGQPYEQDFFSADGLHPSSQGYKILYDWMLKTLDERAINLEKL